jgi:ribosomal protein L7Ae-like RNA K-turn-binding protein
MKDNFLQFLGLTKRAGKLAEGYNQSEETIKRKTVYLVILSTEVSNNTKEMFMRICQNKNIKVLQHYSSEELGEAVGRAEVNVLCITDKQMGEKLKSLYRMLESNRG